MPGSFDPVGGTVCKSAGDRLAAFPGNTALSQGETFGCSQCPGVFAPAGSADTVVHEETVPFCSLRGSEISFRGYVSLHGYFVFWRFYVVNIAWNLII